MIHSLSGGVIANNGYHTFVKARMTEGEMEGLPCWFLSNTSDVAEGDTIIAPVGRRGLLCKGEVVKVEKNVSSQCAPYPMNRITTIEGIIKKE